MAARFAWPVRWVPSSFDAGASTTWPAPSETGTSSYLHPEASMCRGNNPGTWENLKSSNPSVIR